MPSKRNVEMLSRIDGMIKTYGSNIVMIDFTGLDSQKTRELRSEIRKIGAAYSVFKNTIMSIYFRDKHNKDYSNLFLGVNGFVFANDGVFINALKYLVKAEKDLGLKVKASIFENRVFDLKETLELSKLPSKSEVIAQVLGALNSAISSFVGVVNNVTQNFVLVLKSLEDKK